MRVFTFVSILVLLAASATQAQQRPAADDRSRAETSTLDAKASAAMADAAREKTEALERARDKRMKSITRGICTGC